MDLGTVQKRFIMSNMDFNIWLGDTLSNTNQDIIGFDVETNGEPFPKTKLAGFSLYHRRLQKVCYIPIDHAWNEVDYNLLIVEVKDTLQKVFDKSLIITHGGAYDFLLMNQLGFKFYNVMDSMLMAIALQFQNFGLKDLVLEFGVAKFNEVISFKKLMEELGFPEKHSDFTKIDIFSSRKAFDYAVKDSIWTVELAEILYNRYIEYIGTTTAGWNLQAQTDTMLLLCESAARGYNIDQDFLNDFIVTYEEELGGLEYRLMNQVRKEMGWMENKVI